MKQTFFFLLLWAFQLSFAQDTNISVISVEKANIVYRGIQNPIKIAVPGAKYYKVTSNGEITKKDSLGNYLLNVTGVRGKVAKIFIESTLENDSIIKEQKEFVLREISHPRANIISSYNGGASEITLSQLKKLKLNIVIDDFTFPLDTTFFRIHSFDIYIEGKEKIWVEGNKITEKAFTALKDIDVGTKIVINVHQHVPKGYRLRPVSALVIKIVEDTANYSLLTPEVTTQYHNTILYRGLENTLNISVPNAKSFKVKAKGLKSLPDSVYTIDVSKIKQDKISLDLEIVDKNDSIIHTKKVLYVRDGDISPKKITVNGKGCSKCVLKMTLAELKDAVIDIRVDDMEGSLTPYVVQAFNIKLPGENIIEVNNDVISDTVFEELSDLPENSLIEIEAFYMSFGFTYDPPPLKIMIVDKL